MCADGQHGWGPGRWRHASGSQSRLRSQARTRATRGFSHGCTRSPPTHSPPCSNTSGFFFFLIENLCQKKAKKTQLKPSKTTARSKCRDVLTKARQRLATYLVRFCAVSRTAFHPIPSQVSMLAQCCGGFLSSFSFLHFAADNFHWGLQFDLCGAHTRKAACRFEQWHALGNTEANHFWFGCFFFFIFWFFLVNFFE